MGGVVIKSHDEKVREMSVEEEVNMEVSVSR